LHGPRVELVCAVAELEQKFLGDRDVGGNGHQAGFAEHARIDGAEVRCAQSRVEVQAKLSSSASSTIETACARQTDYESYAETLSNDLTGVDVAAVTAKLSTYQGQLTAPSKILSLNLASYLK
jgi:hypothetical protein